MIIHSHALGALLAPARRLPPARVVSDDAPDLLRQDKTNFVDRHRWNKLLAGFDDASFEQTATFAGGTWGDARTTFLTVERGGRAIGGACVVTFDLPMVPGGLAYIKHGPVWRSCGRVADAGDYRSVLKALVAEYGLRRGLGLVVTPRPNPDWAPVETRILREMGFATRGAARDPNRYLVDVTLAEQAQWRAWARSGATI